LALAVLLGAAVIGGGVFVYAQTQTSPPPPQIKKISQQEAPNPMGPKLVVHVAGMVKTPGLYELPDGSRVADALQAAGGALEEADLDSLNLAEIVSDGIKIFVPKKGEGATGETGPGGEQPKGNVNLNSATQEQLEALPGVGPVLAERIIAYRKTKGRFTSLRQLLEVEGIGTKKYDALKNLLTV
ncbi:MAG: helix-hairpin-helix domain-containing protein, partial [Acidimicrobiia bacterium]